MANWVAISSTYGVAGVVRFGNLYLSVPERLIDGLKMREDDTGHVVLPEAHQLPFKKGRVSVILGEADIVRYILRAIWRRRGPGAHRDARRTKGSGGIPGVRSI